MQTKNGTKVTELKFIEHAHIYVGLVNGKPMIWDAYGRRTKKKRSKLDLNLFPPVKTIYVNVLKYGSKVSLSAKKYASEQDAKNNKNKFYVKTIAIEI